MVSSCSYMVTATFLKGTNVLDDIEICNSLFLIHETEPPFRDDSGILEAVVYDPIMKVFEESWEKEHEGK